MNKNNVKIIALAGGPASGKSSVIKQLKQMQTDPDTNILFLDEVATAFIHNRPPMISNMDNSILRQFYIMRTQLFAEQVLLQNAAADKPTVLITDRGCLDAFVYLSDKELEVFKNEHMEQLWDRYDHVVYLRGSVDNFLIDKETQRLEEDEETVRDTQDKAYRVWSQCKSFTCIEQQESIEQKVKQVIEDIHSYLHKAIFL